MPHAVVVGTDATALHVGGQLAARGFQVTLLEATHTIGGQWVQRLFADSADCDFNAVADGLFLDFPFPPSRSAGSCNDRQNCGELVNDESLGPMGNKPAIVEQQQQQPAPDPTAPPTDQQLLEHLAEYAQAAGLHRGVRLGCTLRRAKWQAMNGCWRLELKTESRVQRGGAQLSADLLVVSRQAVAAARLPRLPGVELYCGTILTVNDQLSGPGGSAVLEQQLRGRNVLVVGPTGQVAAGWAEACRRHAGCGGSVVLLELEDDECGAPPPGGAAKAAAAATSPLSCLFGSCFSGGADGARAEAAGRQRMPRLDRFSPAQVPGGGGELTGGAGLLPPDRGSGTSGTLEDTDGVVEAEEGVGLDPALAAVGKLEESMTGPVSVSGGARDAEDAGCERQHQHQQAGVRVGGGEGGGGSVKKAPPEGGDSGGGSGGTGSGGRGPKLEAGRSSLRVLRGVTALLNGTHVMLSTGEELPAEVVLLVPLGGLETSLAFLDAGAPLRLSQAGGSSVGGSFRRAGTSLADASTGVQGAAAGAVEPLSRQLESLYRDMLSCSPFAPNFALIGAGPRAAQHDARTAAVQAAWLLATWVAPEDDTSADGGPTGQSSRGGGGGLDLGWFRDGAPMGGFLRTASPVEAAADAALRGRWRREAAKRRRSDLYSHRYLQQLLTDLGRPLKVPAPSKWSCGVGIASLAVAPPPPTREQLTRQKIAKLLGLKRLRRPRPSTEEAFSRGQSPRASPGRLLGYSSSGVFAGAHGAAAAAAAAAGGIMMDRGSGFVSREVSHGGAALSQQQQLRHSNSATLALRDRAASAAAGGSLRGSGMFEPPPARSEGSFPQISFASQGGWGGAGGPSSLGSLTATHRAMLLAEAGLSNGHCHHSGHSLVHPSLSFGLGTTHAVLSQTDLQLYRVAEHPAEHLGDSGTAAAAVATGGGGMGQLSKSQAQHQLYQQQQQYPQLLQQQQQQVLPSCPSSPSMAQATAVLAGADSISGSIGSVRGRLVATGAPLSSPAAAVAAAGSVASSPGNQPASAAGCGVGGAAEAAAAVAAAGAAVVMGVSCGATAVGGGGGDESGALCGSQQRLRSQLLQRHRSTSRLAGVSNATSLPSGGQPLAGGISGTLTQFFGRRGPVVSTSQVSFDIPNSFLTDRRSQSGRPSHTGSSSRRNHPVSLGGGTAATACSGGGGTGLVSRANSAVRLQLLLAAASSASRRRTAMTPASPSVSASSEPYSYCPVGGACAGSGGGDVRLQLHTAHSEALQPLHAMYDNRFGVSGPPGGGAGAVGRVTGRTSGVGASVAHSARAVRVSGGAAANAFGSVSEPVAGDIVQPMVGFAPSSLQQNTYGKVGETASAQLPAEAAAVAEEVTAAAAGRIIGAASGGYVTSEEQQWGNGDGAGGSGDGSDAALPVGWRRQRCRSFTMPDLRYGAAGVGGHLYAGPYLEEDGGYADIDGCGDGGSGDGGGDGF